MEKIFWTMFLKRSLICYCILIFLIFTCVLRIADIATSDYAEAGAELSSIKIKITNQRGSIFDCNGYPLTNSNKKILAAISPTPRAITAISSILKGKELENVLELLKSGKPAVCEIPKNINCDGIVCIEVYSDSNYIPAIHTIGYCNNENKGMSGLQKAYDEFLYNPKSLYVRYAADGKGRILPGVAPEIQNKISPTSYGIISTIDINIQNIIETEAEFLNRGSIIVADVNSSKIRGIVSMPTFTTDEIENLLNEESSPLFNRSLGAYNVGSAFKLCVAAAGIESGNEAFEYDCKGSFKIIDRSFKCHKTDGHKLTDLENAIAESCNTYFYNYSFKIGKENILNMASNLNFGKSIRICKGIKTAKGSIPQNEKLNNLAHLANFSIGQGDFSATPISLLPLYCAIANDGKYYLPSIIEGITQDGEATKYDYGSPTVAFSKTTADKLKKALKLVVSQGTGVLANPKTVTAAGKTATAQTGKFKNGKEIKSSWFCGFFPYENPKYAIIVFCEDGSLAQKSCAEIFASIADKINLM